MSSRDYFRRDRIEGISPPNLMKDCSYSEHIVRARGKKTQFTSVSLNPTRICCFGDALYMLLIDLLSGDGHELVEHDSLLQALRLEIEEGDKATRTRAIRALEYARRRSEGLVAWNFDISGVERKDLINWAAGIVGRFFQRMQ